MQAGRERILLFATVFWIVGLPTFLIPATRATQSVPVLKAERAVFFAVAGLLAVDLVRRGARRRLDGLDLVILAYLAFALASSASTMAGKDLAALKADADFLLTCFVMPFAAYFAARQIEWTERRIDATLWALVIGAGACLALIGLVQTFHDWRFLVPEGLFAHPDRAKGTFRDGVVFGVTMTLFLLAVLLLHLRAAGRSGLVLSIALAIAIVECLVGSKTRVVWLTAPIVLAFVALRLPRLRVTAGLFAAALAIQVLVAPSLRADHLGVRARLTHDKPVMDRVALLATSLDMIRERPLLGYGVGIKTFRENKVGHYASFGDVPASRAEFPGHPHNDFLNVLVLMGVVGLVLYVALLLSIWRALESAVAHGRRIDSRAGALAVTAQAAFLVLLITGQSHDVMYMSYPQVLFFFLLGMAVAQQTRAQPEGAG